MNSIQQIVSEHNTGGDWLALVEQIYPGASPSYWKINIGRLVTNVARRQRCACGEPAVIDGQCCDCYNRNCAPSARELAEYLEESALSDDEWNELQQLRRLDGEE